MNILIVDDEPIALDSLQRMLKYRGIKNVSLASDGSEALQLINEIDFDVVLLDILMPEISGLKVLEKAKPLRPLTEFIMVTALDETASAVKAIHLGAYDYLVKPIDPDRLVLAINRAYERRALNSGLSGWSGKKSAHSLPESFAHIVTRSPRMRELIQYAHIMARSERPILITGETGTGKELFAQGIHRAGPRSGGPFVPINVPSVPESLFESQFYGYAKGAFTGAERDHSGYFEQAQEGVLYLDEIGELPPSQQVKLLRVLEDRVVMRLGENRRRHLDMSLVSSTNRNLDEACRTGVFRLDLLYRIKGAHVHLPPLRERPEDIPLLATHFLDRFLETQGKPPKTITANGMEVLLQLDYPGNVRELKHRVENAALTSDTETLSSQHLTHGEEAPQDLSHRHLQSLKDNEAAHVAFVLQKTQGNKKETARILGITVRQVQRKVAQLKEHPQWRRLIAHDQGA